MERYFLVAVTIMLLSITTVLAEGTGESKAKEWPYGPYDKLHQVPDKTLPTVIIIRSETYGTTTNRSRTNLMYRGTQSETVETPGTNAIVLPKLQLPTR